VELIVLGIDHERQCHDQGLKAFISELVERKQVTLIAEENRLLLNTVGRQVSESMNLPWLQIDMSTEEGIKAGIQEKMTNRMQTRGYDKNGYPKLAIRYAPREDGIREEFWLDKIEASDKNATALVICGCLHCIPLCEKARRRLTFCLS